MLCTACWRQKRAEQSTPVSIASQRDVVGNLCSACLMCAPGGHNLQMRNLNAYMEGKERVLLCRDLVERLYYMRLDSYQDAGARSQVFMCSVPGGMEAQAPGSLWVPSPLRS